jgi:hypothetical protein
LQLHHAIVVAHAFSSLLCPLQTRTITLTRMHLLLASNSIAKSSPHPPV